MRTSALTTRRPRARQCGLTLIEMSVTILIALFLLAGLFSMVQSTRRTYTNQTQLTQLHDSERMAMTLLTDVIQSAGYFPDPTTYQSSILPAVGTWVSGQGLLGTAPGGNLDTVAVRFATKGGDTILNCLGNTNTNAAAAAPVVYTNTFSLSAPDASGNRSLQCTLDDGSGGATPTVALVSGVQSMQVYYGIRRTPAGATNDNNVEMYLLADEMQTDNPNHQNDWTLISAVRVVLTFNNPLAAPSATTGKTITFERVIAVMNRAGVAT